MAERHVARTHVFPDLIPECSKRFMCKLVKFITQALQRLPYVHTVLMVRWRSASAQFEFTIIEANFVLPHLALAQNLVTKTA